MCHAEGHRPDGDRLVLLYHVYEGAFGPSLDGSGRDKGHCVFHLQQQPRIDELIGKQGPVLVGEDGLQPHGARVGIDLVINGQQRPGREFVFLFTVKGVYGQLLAGLQPFQDRWQIVLGNCENHGNRRQLGNDQQSVAVVRTDHVALVHQPQADTAADRRRDPAVDQLQLRIVDLPLIGFHDPFRLTDHGLLRIQLLLGNKTLFVQTFITFVVQLGVFQLRLVARHLPFGLNQLHLERARINLGQQLAALDDLSLLEEHLHELSVDTAFHVNRIQRDDGTQAVEIHADVAMLPWSTSRRPTRPLIGAVIRL